MKIKDFRTWVVGNPPPHFGGRYFIFVKLTTDDRIEGIGEVYAATFGPHVVARMVEDVCERHVAGADPFHTEALWRRVYGSGYSQRPDLSAQRAADYVAQGFTAVKFDPAGPYGAFDPRQPDLDSLDRSERFAKAIREAVGAKADLLFGAHGQFTPSGAIRMARRLEPYDPLWFEEPVPPKMPEEMAKVARRTSIPIATGERLCTKYEFARVLETAAASILQMALGRVGGLLEAKKIAGMAETHYAQIAPHLYCGPVEGAANIQISTCSPNFLILESIRQWDGFHAQILKKPIRWEDGNVIPPTEPGLGVELNEEVADAHPYEDTALHLEMADRPL